MQKSIIKRQISADANFNIEDELLIYKELVKDKFAPTWIERYKITKKNKLECI